MKIETKHERIINRPFPIPNRTEERGNALIYVLIAIALFAALSLTFGRQTDTDEAGALSDEKAELYATQLIDYATQTKSVVDQMIFTGSDIDELDFTLPTDGAFNTGSHINKIYHPEGGGLNPARIPAGAIDENITDPPAGWYLGRFNNVEWTALGPGNTEGDGGTEAPYEDVILVAYQIKQAICEKINLKITGSTAIPTMNDSIQESMIDDAHYTGTNVHLTTVNAGDICHDCDHVSSLCVQNQAGTAYGFYTIVADQ